MAKEMDTKCRIIVPRLTDPEKAKEQNEIANALNQISEEDARKAGRRLKKSILKKEKQERREKEEQERRKKEIPQEIKDFRKIWEDNISVDIYIGLDDETKNKIIEATNKMAPEIKIEPDGSRRIEMKIGGKEYKILDINTERHTDDEYGYSQRYNWSPSHEVKLGGMRGDIVDNWKNKKLRKYVKKKQKGGLHIPKVEEIRSLLNELGKEAGITQEENQIAMLMYLTGMYGRYWLSMGDWKNSNSLANSRSVLQCRDDKRYFEYDSYDYICMRLCMIASS